MKKLLPILSLIILPAISKAQSSSIAGNVIDTAAKKPLAFATVSLINASDSTLVTFTRADSSGKFLLRAVAKGKYRLSASYVSYFPAWIDVSIKHEDEHLNIGSVIVHDLKSLGDVTVITKRPPVTLNNDTLEFNAENFKTQPNAVVEDLLKKMPGVTIDNDGTVRVNGQKINRVLVNGKEFFTGDPKMATKNLPADAIDKVQVFDKKSDRAEFTGIDDGNSEKAINLKLKKDRNNALFGKLTAGGGTDGRYDAQGNINKFKGEQQLSVLGMGNNTNRQGFSFSDALSFSGDMMRNMKGGGGMVIKTGGSDDNNGLPVAGVGNAQQGVAKTYAGGVNYNDKWGKKTDINASYIINDMSIKTDKETNRQNLLQGNNFNYLQNSSTVRDNLQHRINMSIDHIIDTFNSIKITPSITFQKSKTDTRSNYVSIKPGDVKLNSGFSNSITTADAMNFRNNILYRKRFAKRGRTFSANLNMNYNQSNSDGNLESNNLFYDSVTAAIRQSSSLNQQINQDAVNHSFGGILTYTEPLGKKSLMEFSYFYNSNIGKSDKKTYDYNSTSSKHDILNSIYSNNFESNYTYNGGTFNIRTQKTKLNYTIGASLQQASLKSYINDKSQYISQSFTDVLPAANLTYRFNNYRNVRLDYSTNTRQPSVTQLQPVPDISDPLNIRIGNPSLKREYSQSLNLNYFSADPATRKNFFAFIGINITNSAIATNDLIDPATGIRISKPVNVNGVYNVFTSFSSGFPIRRLKSSINLGTSVVYANNIAFINNNRNNITNLAINPNLSWNFNIENKIDLQATARIGFNNARYTLQPQQNNNYLQQQYGLEMANYLPLGFIISNSFSYIKTSGRAAGYNTSVPYWNASLARAFMKNKRAELKVSGFDLLNQNIGITRNANQNYLEDVKYNVLKRYFLLGFTYSLNKSGLNSGPRAIIRPF